MGRLVCVRCVVRVALAKRIQKKNGVLDFIAKKINTTPERPKRPLETGTVVIHNNGTKATIVRSLCSDQCMAHGVTCMEDLRGPPRGSPLPPPGRLRAGHTGLAKNTAVAHVH